MPIMELFFYGFTLWLGAYLLTRDSQKATVQLTGWGLIAYAVALAIQILFDQFILIILPGGTNRKSHVVPACTPLDRGGVASVTRRRQSPPSSHSNLDGERHSACHPDFG